MSNASKLQQYSIVNIRSIELAPFASRPKSKGLARTHHMRFYKHTIVPRLRLLRTNKQVNEEATEIFYGSNQFRFSNDFGFAVLNFFCRTIGPKNAAMIRSIAERFPLHASEGDAAGTMSVNGWNNFEILMQAKMGMRGFQKRPKHFRDASVIMGKDCKLQQYSIVISEDVIPASESDVSKSGGLLKWASGERLAAIEKRLVVLDSAGTPTPGGGTRPTFNEEMEERIAEVAEQLESEGWVTIRTKHDRLGRYELPEGVATAANEAGGKVEEEDEG